ncbi:pantetheine-phosphate adenylyltransferase [Aureimonas fodinaquatilis]|uniref:Phosphopantetheine adenylyltransferase n=1 Tax=Aureimonas fodinaquatilis TaxID=2565783 RepID=A0A5B0DX05_9HYPH|nr:pantetheine-phosphate adenylyltransferase [Aureimonas fodinaquatilis]KAA0970532.1 pantetheine-phosphate adenylyltransferase [Aureimonas fodinaquatilis]
MNTPRRGLYSGSFDPLTNGHLDVLARGLQLFDELIVAIGIHPGKTPMFSPVERTEMIAAATRELAGHERLRVVEFSGLVVDVARSQGAGFLLRGLRDGTDLDYEFQMSGMNRQLAPAIDTIFLPASTGVRPITATLVRQIAQMGGDIGGFVPPVVAKAIKEKVRRAG